MREVPHVVELVGDDGESARLAQPQAALAGEVAGGQKVLHQPPDVHLGHRAGRDASEPLGVSQVRALRPLLELAQHRALGEPERLAQLLAHERLDEQPGEQNLVVHVRVRVIRRAVPGDERVQLLHHEHQKVELVLLAVRGNVHEDVLREQTFAHRLVRLPRVSLELHAEMLAEMRQRLRGRPHAQRGGFLQHDRRALARERARALSGRAFRDQFRDFAVGCVRERAHDQTGGDEILLAPEHERDARAAVR